MALSKIKVISRTSKKTVQETAAKVKSICENAKLPKSEQTETVKVNKILHSQTMAHSFRHASNKILKGTNFKLHD